MSALQSLFALGLLAVSTGWAQENRLTDAERREGWRLLFDGLTSEGWLEVTGKPFPTHSWTIEDGCLRALVRTDGFQDIRTAASFRSFDLQFDWKLLADGNSGVKYFIQKTDEWTNQQGRQARARGLEYQLADNSNSDVGSDPTRVTASLYSVLAPRIPPSFRIGEFNQSRIVVQGGHVEHWLNDVKMLEFDISQPAVSRHLLTLRGSATNAAPREVQSAFKITHRIPGSAILRSGRWSKCAGFTPAQVVWFVGVASQTRLPEPVPPGDNRKEILEKSPVMTDR